MFRISLKVEVVLVHNYGMIVGKNARRGEKWLEGIEYLMNYHVKLLMIKGQEALLYKNGCDIATS